ncbi:MAG: aminotransferase class IV [Candidatus Zixiibacteriota bacterium]
MLNKKVITVTTINGKPVKRGEDKISVFDNAFLYAEGLFETLLVVDKKIFFINEHINRLFKGARVLGLTVPVDKNNLARWMKKTINAHPGRIIQLRLTLTSGESARWVGVPGEPQVILSAAPYNKPMRPFKLFVSDFKVDQKSVFRRIKTLSYAIHAVALRQAKEKKCDDALLLNEKNQIAEVTSANIFWAKNNHIYTPPISAGCLEGITRKAVIKKVKQLGYKISEKNSSLENLLKADELFITSSLKLVVGVSKIQTKQKSYKFNTGSFTNILSEHFNKLTKTFSE